MNAVLQPHTAPLPAPPPALPPTVPSSRLLLLLWCLVLAALPIWMAFDIPGWDVAIYHSAIRALHAGHDPYADAIAVQNLFHAQHALHPKADPPYSYVYSPITLPMLRVIGAFPTWFSGGLYWFLYAGAVLAQLWAGVWSAESRERPVMLFLAPVAAFFPGLLANGILLSGNIAYLLYAIVFVTAIYAWQGASWRWFYTAVLAASCVKAPLLSLVVIPVLSARRQVLPAALTGALGAGLFALQPLLWPTLFRHYLQAVELQFSYNRDFGCSPAGLFSGVLYDRSIPYAHPSILFYLAYAIPLFAVLVALSRRYLSGHFPLTQWAPILFLGVVLLNPRLIEYDVAPLALPMALIAWRFVRSVASAQNTTILLTIVFMVTNTIGLTSWDRRKLLDGPLLVLLFVLGVWTLLRRDATSAPPQEC